jgi:N-acetylglucosamine kinase-like BadF-type ATPase
MYLIADAGATKINWALLNKDQVIEFNTPGYNPNVADSNYLRQLLISGFPTDFNPNEVSSVLYFGAGCGSVFGKERVQKALKTYFTMSLEIKVMTDLEGAALAVFNKSEGIIGILGTGANAGFYNGNAIIDSPISLGYLLGDEGSGAYLGKLLIPKIIRNEFDLETVNRFYEFYSLTPAELIKNIYSATQPNKYLGSFVPFIRENSNNPEMEQLVKIAFQNYYKIFMEPIVNKHINLPVAMIGGVAFAFKNQLTYVFESNNINNFSLTDSPLKLMVQQLIR